MGEKNSSKRTKKTKRMAKITGIGGVFLISEDDKKLKNWYSEKLGMEIGEWGGGFHWRGKENVNEEGFTAWNVFNASSDYLKPGNKKLMINYRVDNLEEFLAEVKAKGVEQIGEIHAESYGKFAWILDADGNKVELWEP